MLMAYAKDRSGEGVEVLVDGPYGGINLAKFQDAEHVLVIAGGSGAGWCLPFIERFVRRNMHREKKGDVEDTSQVEALRTVSMSIVLATRDIASRMWFLSNVDKLLEKYKYSDVSGFRVQVYLTGTAARNIDVSHVSSETSSSPDTIDFETKRASNQIGHVPGRECEGRPDLASIISEKANEMTNAGQLLSVFVCGPTTMLNDARNAVAAENLRVVKGDGRAGVYLHSEHFSWA